MIDSKTIKTIDDIAHEFRKTIEKETRKKAIVTYGIENNQELITGFSHGPMRNENIRSFLTYVTHDIISSQKKGPSQKTEF